MDEMKTILNAILKNQETTNSKIEALTMDVRKMQGNIVQIQGDIVQMQSSIVQLDEKVEAFRSETNGNFRKFGRHLDAIETDLDKTINRVEFLELKYAK